MFQISWFHVFYFSFPALMLLVLFWTRRAGKSRWVKAVAEQLGGKVKGPKRIEGMTAGLPWEVTLTLGLSSHAKPS